MSVSVCFLLQALQVWRGSNEGFSLFLTASLAGMAASLAGMARE